MDTPPPLPSVDELIGKKEIARLLKVHIRTVRRWCRERLLPFPDFQCSGVKRWYRWRIEAWVKAGGTRDRRKKPETGGQSGQKRTNAKRGTDPA
jgi:hypothetical protein